MLELFRGGVLGKSDFEDSEESFLFDFDETLFAWFPDINNFAFVDMDDLVKALDLAPDYL